MLPPPRYSHAHSSRPTHHYPGGQPVPYFHVPLRFEIVISECDINGIVYCVVGFPDVIAQLVKNLPAMQETPVQLLSQEDPLEKGKATHSSILAWRAPWTV